jgi:hypothetical protein
VKLIQITDLHVFTAELGISGSPKVNDNYNPATWMLEVNSASMESELGLDFAELHKESLCTCKYIFHFHFLESKTSWKSLIADFVSQNFLHDMNPSCSWRIIKIIRTSIVGSELIISVILFLDHRETSEWTSTTFKRPAVFHRVDGSGFQHACGSNTCPTGKVLCTAWHDSSS